LKKNIQKFIKKIIKNSLKKSSKILEKHQKNQQKILPGLAKKYFFPIKIKISAKLFSIKIKRKIFFLGLGEKKHVKNRKSQDWSPRMECPIVPNFWADQLDDITIN
jgi:hypothetical protein